MNEINVNTSDGQTIYAVVRQGTTIWNTVSLAFETFTSGNYAKYAIPLTSLGGQFYSGNFPTAITTPGTYYVTAYVQVGASPADDTDSDLDTGKIEWSGGNEILPNSNALCTASLVQSIEPKATNTVLLNNVLIPQASAAVCNWCRNNFVIQTYSELRSIPVTTRSLVLKHIPIVSITSVQISFRDGNTTVIPGTDYSFDNSGEIIQYANNSYPNVFPEGIQNVMVIYEAGYAIIPADVQYATARVVQNAFRLVGQDTTMKSEKYGQDYQYMRDVDWKKCLSEDVQETLKFYRVFNV